MMPQKSHPNIDFELSKKSSVSCRRIAHFNHIMCSEISAAYIKTALVMAGAILTILVTIACLFQ